MLSFFPRTVLDEIWDLIGLVSEGVSCLLVIKSEKEIKKYERTNIFSKVNGKAILRN